MILLMALVLTGCKTISDYKPDTIVDIPLHPTEEQTAEATGTASIPTEVSTEAGPVATETEPTEPATQPAKNNTGSKPSGGKKPGQGGSNKKPSPTNPPTEPPTQPPTEAPTDPPVQPPTQTPTEAPTQAAPTEAPDEPPTEPATEPPAEIPTEVPTIPDGYDPFGYVPGSLDHAVAEQIDARRQAEGLGALHFDHRLCAIASVRARETSQTWSNSRPDGSAGITVLAEYGVAYSAAAENLYFGPADAAAMVDKWMSSDSRRANLLMEAADAIGVGSYTAADGVTFIAVLIVG